MPIDQDIKKNIQDSLYWDDRVDSSTIDVEVSDGKVTLKGTAPSHFAKTAATDDALFVNGVRAVDNEMTVVYPPSVQVLTDDEIKISLENIFTWDSDIVSDDIDTKIDAGVVTLTGHVDKLWKKYYIEKKAVGISGVMDVINEIIVTPKEDVVDEIIGQDIINAIERTTLIDINNINVEVNAGEVTLSGEVPTWYDYNRINESALYTPGVIKVDNNLVITGRA